MGRSLAPADHTDKIRCLGARQLLDHAHSLLIDCEEDRTLRAVVVGMLREDDRGR